MKRILKFLIPLVVLVLALGGIFMALPKVFFLLPGGPEVYGERLSRPSFFGKGYLVLTMKEGEEYRYSALNPKVVVYSPVSEIGPGDWTTVQWGNAKSEADVVVTLDKVKMWEGALEALRDKPVGILYSTTDSFSVALADRLLEHYPNAVPVTYSGRVNTIVRNEIVLSLDALYAVLVLDPATAEEAYRRTTSRVVMDFRDAAAAVTKERVIAVAPDWEEVIQAALQGESEVSPDFALSVTKK